MVRVLDELAGRTIVFAGSFSKDTVSRLKGRRTGLGTLDASQSLPMNECQNGHQVRVLKAGVQQRIPDVMAPQADPDSGAVVGRGTKEDGKERHAKILSHSTGEVYFVSIQQHASLVDGADS